MNENYHEIWNIWFEQIDDYLKQEEPGKDIFFIDLINIAVVEGRRRDTLDMLGYSELTQDYDYNSTYEDVFLNLENLGTFLDQLNQFMKENYPEIEFEDITIQRLQPESYQSYDIKEQLRDTQEKLAEQGVDFSQIVELIHGETDGEVEQNK